MVSCVGWKERDVGMCACIMCVVCVRGAVDMFVIRGYLCVLLYEHALLCISNCSEVAEPSEAAEGAGSGRGPGPGAEVGGAWPYLTEVVCAVLVE